MVGVDSSFFSSKPLEEAIEIINDQKADLIFFTGDLVNEISEEAVPFIPVLDAMKNDSGLVDHVRSYLTGGGKPSTTIQERLGLDEDFVDRTNVEC